MYILHLTLEPSLIVPLIFGIQLLLLISTNYNTSSRSLRPSLLVISFVKSIRVILLLWCSYKRTPHGRRNITSMLFCLIKLNYVPNSALLLGNCCPLCSYSIHHRLLCQCLVRRKNSPLARCSSAADVSFRDVNMFGAKIISLNYIINGPFFILKYSLYAVWMYVYSFPSSRIMKGHD
jgi:hypothetical protein